MSLYQEWLDIAQAQRTQDEYSRFWATYFAMETENYKKILKNFETPYTGALKDLAETFEMDPVTFTGFLDGINSSLRDGELELDSLTEESEVALVVDFDKLYLNMHEAKADWLYNLKEWEGVRTEEERKALTKQYRAGKIFVAEKTVGRNDPCPCGSGKKYKKCCGK